MKRKLSTLVSFVILLLLIINVYIYTRTIVLENEIVSLEHKTKELQVQNDESEKKLTSYQSLRSLEKIATAIGFSQEAQSLVFDNLNLAKSLSP